MLINKNNINSLELSKQDLLEQGCTFLVNKELTWTSNDVVSKFRSLFKTKRVGHAGSLDPFATGLLIVSVGKDTKKINDYSESIKVYRAVAKLGAETNSYDAEHPEKNLKNINSFKVDILNDIFKKFTGKFKQTAPIYSAKKIKGRRQYELARKNIEVIPKVKEVEIFQLSLLDYYKPFFEFDISCTKGTYIRSLAYDIGIETGFGAYLFKLTRTSIGDFSCNDSLKINDIIKHLK